MTDKIDEVGIEYEYVFYREGGFYTIMLNDDMDAISSALHNDGTIKVKSINGREIWPDPLYKYVLATSSTDYITNGRAYIVADEEPNGFTVIDDSGNKSFFQRTYFKK